MSRRLKKNSEQKIATWFCVVVLAFVFCPILPVWAETVDSEADVTSTAVAELDRQQQLEIYSYILWQRINEARNDPQAVIDRLHIPVEQAKKVLGDDAWVLDRGLSPLAWNQQLQSATQNHGRDMLDQLYYSHISSDGSSSYDRMVAAGYQPVVEGETLGALVFSSFIDVEIALDAMLDVILRDELTGVSDVQRNIFSPQLTEVGVSFFAESIELLDGQPYVYLLVLDFATPIEPEYFIIGAVDKGDSLAMESSYTGFWEPLPLSSEGFFQVSYPVGGATLMTYSSENQVSAAGTVYEANATHNHYLDLRSNDASQ